MRGNQEWLGAKGDNWGYPGVVGCQEGQLGHLGTVGVCEGLLGGLLSSSPCPQARRVAEGHGRSPTLSPS